MTNDTIDEGKLRDLMNEVSALPTSIAPPADAWSKIRAEIEASGSPDSHPIKGNKAGRQESRPTDPIYHVPGSRYYGVTDPEECFATVEDAEGAGYRAPLR